MKAMLLAAGRGTRLAPLSDSTPKILAPVAGRPLLACQLEYLQSSGVDEIALNVHHHAEQVLACLRDLEPQVPVRVSYEPVLLGTAGALAPLRDFFDQPAIVLYGDVLTDADLALLMAEHVRHEPTATLALYRSSRTAGKGIVQIDEQTGTVQGFLEKPSHTPADVHGEPLINAGLYVVSPALLDLIGPGFSDFGQHVWPRALATGHPLRASVLDGAYVRDVGTPETLAAAGEDLATGALSW
jgi:mannose-1-phosphate guanylyltransferase